MNAKSASAAMLVITCATQAGNLSPPAGPVLPSMKTLDQVEPRIPVNSINTPGDIDSIFRISAPGSYYLTGDIAGVTGKHAIEIASSDVSLDLNGFTLDGSAAISTLSGVSVEVFVSYIEIRNGRIRNFDGSGIDGVRALRSRVSDVTVSACGGIGIQMNSFSIVRNCQVGFTTGIGISVSRLSQVIECSVTGTGPGSPGILAGDSSRVEACVASDNGDDGIRAFRWCLVTDCVANGNTARGIVVTTGVVSGCFADNNGSEGISASGDGCVISACAANSNGTYGIRVVHYATITDCAVMGNGLDGIAAVFAVTVSQCAAGVNGASGFDVGDQSSVSHCTAYRNGANGIVGTGGGTISNCTAFFNGGDGMQFSGSSSITNCTSNRNVGDGIQFNGVGGHIEGCTASLNEGDGIRAGGKCTILSNQCRANGLNQADGAGIHVLSSFQSEGARIDGNTVIDNDRGIEVDSGFNIIIRNVATRNSVNYDIAPFNALAQIVAANVNSVAVAGPTYSGNIGTTSPWANFSY